MVKKYQPQVLASVPALDVSFGGQRIKCNGLEVIADEIKEVQAADQKEFVYVVGKSGTTYTLASKNISLIKQCKVPGAVFVRIIDRGVHLKYLITNKRWIESYK
jgi:hypothetical protein